MFYIRKRNSIEQGIAEKYVEECMLKNRKDWIPDGESILMNLKMKEATLSGEEQEKDLEE